MVKWKNFSSLNLDGTHSILSPSKHSWLNYDEQKMTTYMQNMYAKEEGTELHALAAELIKKGITLEAEGLSGKKTLNMYVNDAIGYHMRPEQLLVYSLNCYGTADAITYNEKKKFLRIHDLKTGTIPASMDQLRIYEALFCLCYDIKPGDITSELRIYQNDEIIIDRPASQDILEIMEKIKWLDQIIDDFKTKQEGE